MSVNAVQSILEAAQPVNLDWPEPVSFSDTETPAISPDWLPPVLRDFVWALATDTETPVEMALACALGTVSTALTGKVVVNPKPGWNEPVNTYWVVELSPANRKSKVFRVCTQPLIAWENEQRKALEPEIRKAASRRKSQERLIEKKRNDAVKIQDNNKLLELFDEIADLEASLEEIPVLPRLFCNNATPEALENFTAEQNGRFAVLSDEGGVMETLTGLYTNGRANLDLLLKGIDGGEVRIGRKDRDITMNPYLTFVLCVQPKIREKMGKNPALQGNGALERFFYVVPRSIIGFRKHNTAPMSPDIQERYNETIDRLLSLSMLHNADGEEQPYALTLSPDAYRDVKGFEAWLEPQLKPFGKLFMCQGWCGKLVGYALRIAGLMHVVEYGIENRQISAGTMHNALWIAYSLLQHTMVAYRLMGMDERIANAKHVHDWFIHEGRKEVSRTELTIAVKHRMKAKELDEALNELFDRHILRTREEPGAGTNNITVYTANPKIFHSAPPVTAVIAESRELPDLQDLPEGGQ